MSAENVELVRRWLLALSARQEETLAAIPQLMDPDAQHHPVRKFPDPRPSRSRREFSSWLERFHDTFSVAEWTIHDLIPVGDDPVLACVALRAQGRASGLRIEGDLFQCYWVRGGRIARIDDHMTLADALQALGLEGATLEEAGLEGSTSKKKRQ